jgi:processive 1,2-diacylglycerol beta-glucosyltransferase
MSKQRVLILSASVGTGHKIAAGALEEAFLEHPDVEVLNQDVLEMTNEAYAKLYADTYQMAAKRMPRLLGWVYDFNDEPFTNEQPLRKLWDMLNAQPVVRFVKDYRPDICVCTHFTPAGIIAQLMATDQLETSLSVVTTDYDFQGMWLSQTFNRYFVARDESKAKLIDLGVFADRITVSGIPVRARFGEPVDRAAVLAKYELRSDRPVILISAGAVGGGPAQEIVAEMLDLRHRVQCVVVCGRNERLLREVEALTLPHADDFRVLGFSTDMLDLVRVATLFVGKPGGLTASECMAAGTPMVIVMPIPGQEERNADYLLEQGAAVRCNDLTTIDYKIGRLLDDPERLARLRANARRVGRPDAARVIATTALADQRRPVKFDSRARIEAARPRYSARTPGLLWNDAPSVVALYDDERGVFIGAMTRELFRGLRRSLTDFDTRAGIATLDLRHVRRLRDLGADASLCQAIETRIARYGPLRIRRTTVPVEQLPRASESA